MVFFVKWPQLGQKLRIFYNFFLNKNSGLVFSENKKISKIGLELTFPEHFEIGPDFHDFRLFGKIGPPTPKWTKKYRFLANPTQLQSALKSSLLNRF